MVFDKESALFNDRPDWNMANLFLTRLDILSGLVDDCMKEGDIVSAYRLIKRIFFRIEYKILKDEEKILFDKSYCDHLKDINTKIKRIDGMLKGDPKILQKNRFIIDDELDAISRTLLKLMWDLHFIFPEKFKISYLDRVKGDFD